jgi:hypothetical protein
MPIQKIPGLDISYALISFDDNGRERTDDPDGGLFSRKVQEQVRQTQPTDIFLFSHGWKGDVPRAIEQYDEWVIAQAALVAVARKAGIDVASLRRERLVHAEQRNMADGIYRTACQHIHSFVPNHN